MQRRELFIYKRRPLESWRIRTFPHVLKIDKIAEGPQPQKIKEHINKLIKPIQSKVIDKLIYIA